MVHTVLQGTAALSIPSLTAAEWETIRCSLTLRQVAGPGIAIEGDPNVSFFIDCRDGWLHVPRGWLFEAPWLMGRLAFQDARSDGRPLPPGTRAHVEFGVSRPGLVVPPGQPDFINSIVEGCQRNGHGGLALAPTRSGKTLCSLEAACRLGRSTLIVVNDVEMMKQWQREVEKHLRVGCGIIREDSFDCSQPFTVATAQTLMRRQLTEEVRRAWGTVIVDECNMVPCMSLWTLLPRLYNRYLIGLTATPDRKDGLGPAIRWIIGPPIARLERKMEADVHWYPVTWTAERALRPSPSPVEVDSMLLGDQGRINRIAGEILRGLQNQRRVLVMATMVEHCAKIAETAHALGAPVDLFVGDASMDALSKPVTVATYKKAAKGLSFEPPHTLFIPAGPVSDIRQAVGRALQPQVPFKTMILHPVDNQSTLIKWANNCARYYSSCGFQFRNTLPEGRWVA